MNNQAGDLTLFEKNRQIFQTRSPDLWRLGEERRSPDVSIVYEEGEAVDVSIGGTLLYQEPAVGCSQKQVENYFDDPDRIGFASPAYCNLSPISKDLLSKVRDYIANDYGEEVSSHPLVDIGFCFVFGIGLGHHLKLLLENNKAKVMVLIEPQPALLRASFEVFDWADFFEAADAQSVEVRFIVGAPPAVIVRSIERYIWDDGKTFIEGSYAYIHYPSWELLEARRLLNERIAVSYISSGFYEDELLMMTNSYGNLHRFPLSFLQRKPVVQREQPVFIVGSGPSLDKDLDVVKKWRNKAIVFSCGTSSLGILLKNGIVPDFHGENENSWPLVENLRNFSKKYDLSPITYVASTSVNPEAGKLFDKRWFYYRTGLSCTASLNRGLAPLLGADPLVANSAMAAMLSVGFRNFYFFGVDCGRRTEHGHHAGEAIYYEDDYDNYLEGESFELLENEFDRVVPANFGGEALTTWYLDMSRASFGPLCQRSDVKVVNCSDGAKIDGAAPKAASALTFHGPEGYQAQLINRIAQTLPSFPAGEYLSGLDLDDLVAKCDLFEDEFLKAMDEAFGEDESFWDFHHRIITLRDRLEAPCRGILSIIRSSLVSMIRVGAFAGTRIANQDDRLAFLRFFMGAYKEKVELMVDDTRNVLGQMAEGRDKIEGVAGVGPE